jgi:hypothetical protein
MTYAREKSKSTGITVGVAPISAIHAYHAEAMEIFDKAGATEPSDLVALRTRARAAFEALAGFPRNRLAKAC